MKIRYLFLLVAFCFNTAWADFSNTQMWFHPLYINNDPFILDFRGEWHTDCHPGEQKPIITEYTGDTVLIEFETIVEHPVCNDTPTAFRVLVDMSDVIDDVPGEFSFIDVTMRFGGEEFVKQLEKICGLRCDPPPPPRDIKPESGLYYSDGLEKQGLIIARQNDRMGVVPHTYDESGSSEWLLGPGGIVEDVFFAELLESTGGQCLSCPPPDEPPQMNVVGKISMLMDNEGVIQVKINDGLFKEYRQSLYGYGDLDISGALQTNSLDLSGRWAFVEVDVQTGLPLPDLSSFVLPLVFDIVLEWTGIDPAAPVPPALEPSPPTVGIAFQAPTHAMFSMRNIEGETIAEMLCGFVDAIGNLVDEMVCNLNSPDLEEGTNPYHVEILSTERIKMTFSGAILGVGSRSSGTAVRID